MDIDTITPTTNTNSNTTQSTGGGVLRLKIKLGKPSVTTNPSDDISSSTTTNDNEQRLNLDLKTSPIRLTLPIIPSTSQTISVPILTRPPIISTINRTPHRRKSGKIKHVPRTNDQKPTNLSLHEDNTVSIDDLPLGERTSPNKTILNNIQTNLSQPIISTPIKKKTNCK